MDSRRHRVRMRPWIAMVAAYAVALQLLLSGFVASHSLIALSGNDPAVICFGVDTDGSGSPQTPGTQQDHSTCCLLCIAWSGGLPPRSNDAIAAPRHVDRAGRPAIARTDLVAPRHSSPRQSQGPPRHA